MATAGDAARRRADLTVLALTVGTALNPLNSSMIAVALLALQRDFELDIATVTWVVTVFYIASIIGNPLMGRLVDAFGPRRVFIVGMSVGLVASVFAPLSGSFLLVCLARGVMALGTSAAYPAAIALVGPLSAQGGTPTPRLLARIQVTNTAGAAIGPVVGGFLVTLAGWEAVFYINVPVALAAIVGVWVLAPRDVPRDVTVRSLLVNLDPAGILAFAVGTTALVVVALGGVGGINVWLLVLGVVALGLFVWRVLVAHRPFIDLRMMATRPLRTVYLAFLVFSTLFYLVFFGYPQFLEAAGGYTPAVVGLLLLPMATSSIVLVPLFARIVERRGVRPMFLWGAALLVPAGASLALGVVTTDPATMLLISLAVGVPYAMLSLAAAQAVQRYAPAGATGVASGLLQAVRYVGAIVASVVLGQTIGAGITPATWGSVAIAGSIVAVVHLVIVLGLRHLRR